MYYADRKYHLFYSGDALDYCPNQNSMFELGHLWLSYRVYPCLTKFRINKLILMWFKKVPNFFIYKRSPWWPWTVILLLPLPWDTTLSQQRNLSRFGLDSYLFLTYGMFFNYHANYVLTCEVIVNFLKSDVNTTFKWMLLSLAILNFIFGYFLQEIRKRSFQVRLNMAANFYLLTASLPR